MKTSQYHCPPPEAAVCTASAARCHCMSFRCCSKNTKTAKSSYKQTGINVSNVPVVPDSGELADKRKKEAELKHRKFG